MWRRVSYRQTKKKTLYLCEMETKMKFNQFKMHKSVHKSKPNKFYGGKLTCRSHTGRRNAKEVLRRKGTMVVRVADLEYNVTGRRFYAQPTLTDV